MRESEYLLSNDAAETAARFGGLEECFDPVTIGHLSRRARPGGRCLEVGAGNGSVARWMAGAVGPAGRVLATDLDVRWCSVDGVENLTVRQHDLVDEPVPEGPWDLIHERLVLQHLPTRLAVLDRLTAALAPGGWLVLEDFDTAEVRTTDRQGPDHALIVRVAVAFNDLLRSRGGATSFAADARRHLADRGLIDIASSGHVAFSAGGTGFARVLAANTVQVRPGSRRRASRTRTSIASSPCSRIPRPSSEARSSSARVVADRCERPWTGHARCSSRAESSGVTCVPSDPS